MRGFLYEAFDIFGTLLVYVTIPSCANRFLTLRHNVRHFRCIRHGEDPSEPGEHKQENGNNVAQKTHPRWLP